MRNVGVKAGSVVADAAEGCPARKAGGRYKVKCNDKSTGNSTGKIACATKAGDRYTFNS